MTSSDVTFVCQWYAPEPVSQPGWIVGALRRQGLDMQVLTGIPNYPTGIVARGYRAWRPYRERIDHAEVRRAPLYPSHDGNSLKRALNYLSWAFSSTIFGLRTLRRSRAALVYSSPATAALPAMVARRLFGAEYVLLVQDVWPDSIFSSGFLGGRKRRIAERLLESFVSATYRDAHHIAVTSPGMADLLASRGVPPTKLSTVYNWVDETEEGSDPALDLRVELGIGAEDFVVMYAGNHGTAQALHTAVDAFAIVPCEANAHLVMVGDGIAKPDLQRRAREAGTSRVHFLDTVPRTEIRDLMEQADAQLVSLARDPLFAVTTPSKLQSVLAAGHPVIVSADGDAARAVRDSHAGLSAPAEDPTALAEAVTELARAEPDARKAMGLNGRAHYDTMMAADVGAERLATLLRAAAARAGGRK